ncbi:NAD(P)-dependent oxidoreductase [Aeromicrobium sp. YIM 150415]|uniref:NAD-dependent epimerase/dehydratase family protein n=1 Tax=Aeromicrobium sp. YIM 150415 TaxID=2803912 RepID=UPI00196314FF|nr:NAD(P)-dependent oxidoreductase [Aeromicrobium sp. YIM 150415]MBM9463227.1 NAD(P)-dependent oxidoreductase [Aeromicrobium sp. YIM 150415]
MTSVLFTGPNGRMNQVIRPALAGEFERVVLYSRSPVDVPHAGESVVLGELDDLDRLAEAMDGVDVVVHMAGKADEGEWEEILASNIHGTYCVLEAARRAGVRRVVYASSHHITGLYRADEPIGPDDPVRPDSYYGVSKAFGEALCRLYHDKWGTEIVSLRIGAFRPRPEDTRHLSVWLSEPDGVRLLRAAILAEDVSFAVVYGVSANRRSWWDPAVAAKAIGYRPLDDAEAWADRVEATPEGPASTYQGGVFASPDYRGGVW